MVVGGCVGVGCDMVGVVEVGWCGVGVLWLVVVVDVVGGVVFVVVEFFDYWVCVGEGGGGCVVCIGYVC